MKQLAALLIFALSFHTQANDISLFQQGLALYKNKQTHWLTQQRLEQLKTLDSQIKDYGY